MGAVWSIVRRRRDERSEVFPDDGEPEGVSPSPGVVTTGILCLKFGRSQPETEQDEDDLKNQIGFYFELIQALPLRTLFGSYCLPPPLGT